VKLQHLGRRKTFTLQACDLQQAAAEACQLYRRILKDGWQNAFANPKWKQNPSREQIPEDESYWAPRLVHREDPMSLGAQARREFSVRIEHQGTRYYFPLGTANRARGARRAAAIYRVIERHGWAKANRRFRRELTLGFRWLDRPLAWTYTTLQAHSHPIRRATATISEKGRSEPMVAIVEADAGLGRALAWCLDQMRGFNCAGIFESARAALESCRRSAVRLILINSGLAERPGALHLESPASGLAVLPYGVYEDSEELFRTTPGGAGIYVLRRTPPNGFLEPLREVLGQEHCSNREMAAQVRQYFQKELVNTTPVSPARPLARLTGREQEVLTLLSQGYRDKNIADLLAISVYTVHEHVRNIFEKLNVHNRTEAVVRFLQK
jgi:DNA-binding NarL/FixJ family response regulator